MEPVIKLENVKKSYHLGDSELSVLKGIDLDIMPGSFVSIMGPSGSGKSTLMYLLGLLDLPTSGKIYLEGRDVSQLSDNELALLRGKKIGFIFQQFNLLPNLTALENVILPMIFQGVSPDERLEKAKKLLKSVDMEKRMNHRPLELSGGEQQRVAISRSLVNDPEIIIADEPTGNLDSKTGKIIMGILSDFYKGRKKTVVVVTHDPNIAEYSQVKINIRDGEIVKNGHIMAQTVWSK